MTYSKMYTSVSMLSSFFEMLLSHFSFFMRICGSNMSRNAGEANTHTHTHKEIWKECYQFSFQQFPVLSHYCRQKPMVCCGKHWKTYETTVEATISNFFWVDFVCSLASGQGSWLCWISNSDSASQSPLWGQFLRLCGSAADVWREPKLRC